MQRDAATGDGADAERRATVGRWLPSAEEVALGTLLGAVLAALVNAVDIAVTVRWPVDGTYLRARHHGADALQTVGLGAWLAAPAAALSSLRLRGPRWLAWLALFAAAAIGMYFLVGAQLEREASKLLDGRWDRGLFVAFVALCGLAVPVAHAVGTGLARLGWPAGLAAALGLGGIVLSHAVLRDDFPPMHAAIAWIAMLLAGGALAPRVLARVGRHRRRIAVAAAVVGCVGVVWEPSNAVRVELFKQPGSAASYVLAQLVWRMPSVPIAAPRPPPAALSPRAFDRALEGIADDPIVVLVTVDALRADVVAEADPERLPTLARLRDQGAYFPHASSAGSQTSVSLASMFASRTFSQLRWEMYGEGWFRFSYPVRDASPRFPALLQQAGVESYSFLPIIFLGDDRGIARGFTREQVFAEGRVQTMVDVVLPPVIRHLAAARAPQLLYTHVMDPHEPYDRGRLRQGSAWERYLSEVEWVDAWLGRLLRTLRSRFPDNGYLIVSADHGEAFGEHGTHFHSKTLYEEMIAVPLVVWGPGIEPRRIDARGSLLDVGPTVMHLFGARPHASFVGQSLLPLIAGDGEGLERLVVAEGRLRRASYHGELKVIEDRVRKLVEVYDLRADPDELLNLFDRSDPRVAAAVAAQRAFFRQHTLRTDGYVPPYRK